MSYSKDLRERTINFVIEENNSIVSAVFLFIKNLQGFKTLEVFFRLPEFDWDAKTCQGFCLSLKIFIKNILVRAIDIRLVPK